MLYIFLNCRCNIISSRLISNFFTQIRQSLHLTKPTTIRFLLSIINIPLPRSALPYACEWGFSHPPDQLYIAQGNVCLWKKEHIHKSSANTNILIEETCSKDDAISRLAGGRMDSKIITSIHLVNQNAVGIDDNTCRI